MGRRLLLACCLLTLTACAPPRDTGEAAGPAFRLLIAGAVDLESQAGIIARADPEGVFREVRLAARRADVAVVAAAPAEAESLLAAAGFDLVACPEPRALTGEAAASQAALPKVQIECAPLPGGEPAPAFLITVRAGVGQSRGGDGAPADADEGLPVVEVALEGEGLAMISGSAGARPGLRVTGLGRLLSGGPSGGALLEVLVDAGAATAYRLGRVDHPDFRVHFQGWDLPTGDTALLGEDWWALARPVMPVSAVPPSAGFAFTYGDLVAAAVGDVTGDGRPDLAASYRHPFRSTALSEARPGLVGVDAQGRSAHLGVFTLDGNPLWAAGYLPRPVGALAACDGALALAYTGLDDPAIAATGAAVWTGLSLEAVSELPGRGEPGCADVDGDGRADPVILGRAG